MMSKVKINFIIDALMMICMSALAGIGFLIHSVLIPGRDAQVIYGGPVDLTFLGIGRHDWGEIHEFIGIFLLLLLLVHIIMHWSMIPAMFRHLVKNTGARRFIGSIFVILCIFLLTFFVFVTPQVDERGQGQGHGHYRDSPTTDRPTAGLSEEDYSNSDQRHSRGGRGRNRQLHEIE